MYISNLVICVQNCSRINSSKNVAVASDVSDIVHNPVAFASGGKTIFLEEKILPQYQVWTSGKWYYLTHR